MYEELGYRHVYHEDVRYQNILRASPSPSALPSLPSPYTQRTHNWRVIDFDNSKKTAASTEDINRVTQGWLKRLLDNLQDGFTIEPWDI